MILSEHVPEQMFLVDDFCLQIFQIGRGRHNFAEHHLIFIIKQQQIHLGQVLTVSADPDVSFFRGVEPVCAKRDLCFVFWNVRTLSHNLFDRICL